LVFLVLSSRDAAIDALIDELEHNELYVVIFYVTDNEKSIAELSSHKSCTIVCISPYKDISKGLGE